jgi:exonuclease SbcD
MVIFTGDAYRSCDPSPTHQRELALRIKKLVDAKIPIIMIPGNHDTPVSFGKASSLDIFGTLGLENIHVVRKPDILRIKTKSGEIQVACLPWPSRNMLLPKDEYRKLSADELTRRVEEICSGIISDFADKIDPDIPSVLAAHLVTGGAVYSGSERSAMIGDDPTILTGVLANPAFDYVALGHIHRFQDLNPNGKPPVVYSGSIDRVDFSESEEEKGFCIVDIKDRSATTQGGNRLPLFSAGGSKVPRETNYRFFPVPSKRFVNISVSTGPDEDPTLKILEKITEWDVRDAIVKVTYTVPEGKESLADLVKIRKALSDAFLVAGIIRRSELPERRLRARISEETAVVDALDRYIGANPRLKDLAEDMKKYAAELEKELSEEASP